jgi:hypothetical protein
MCRNIHSTIYKRNCFSLGIRWYAGTYVLEICSLCTVCFYSNLHYIPLRIFNNCLPRESYITYQYFFPTITYRTFKKSTATYKVLNICLRYINTNITFLPTTFSTSKEIFKTALKGSEKFVSKFTKGIVLV